MRRKLLLFWAGASLAALMAAANVSAQTPFYLEHRYIALPRAGTGPPLGAAFGEFAPVIEGYPEERAATTIQLAPAVFMTSLNYPGVYGSYYNGPGGDLTPIMSTAAILSPTYGEADQSGRIEVRVPANADVWL